MFSSGQRPSSSFKWPLRNYHITSVKEATLNQVGHLHSEPYNLLVSDKTYSSAVAFLRLVGLLSQIISSFYMQYLCFALERFFHSQIG
jgi:hypothetical protein